MLPVVEPAARRGEYSLQFLTVTAGHILQRNIPLIERPYTDNKWLRNQCYGTGRNCLEFVRGRTDQKRVGSATRLRVWIRPRILFSEKCPQVSQSRFVIPLQVPTILRVESSAVDPKWFIPDPGKSSGSMGIRIQAILFKYPIFGNKIKTP